MLSVTILLNVSITVVYLLLMRVSFVQYGIYSNERPGRSFNFGTSRGGGRAFEGGENTIGAVIKN